MNQDVTAKYLDSGNCRVSPVGTVSGPVVHIDAESKYRKARAPRYDRGCNKLHNRHSHVDPPYYENDQNQPRHSYTMVTYKLTAVPHNHQLPKHHRLRNQPSTTTEKNVYETPQETSNIAEREPETPHRHYQHRWNQEPPQ